MVRETIRCFLGEVDSVLPQMHAILQTGDFGEIGRLVHRMKGTIVCLGASQQAKPRRVWNASFAMPENRTKSKRLSGCLSGSARS